MPFTLVRSVAGLALLAALAAGCGTAVAAHSTAPKPAATTHSVAPKPPAAHRHRHSRPMRHTATTPPATAPGQPANPIPQGNGGDQDADNNGGPSDGDGNI
jgi:hypothetical protein